jgi:hypothetical protein
MGNLDPVLKHLIHTYNLTHLFISEVLSQYRSIGKIAKIELQNNNSYNL